MSNLVVVVNNVWHIFHYFTSKPLPVADTTKDKLNDLDRKKYQMRCNALIAISAEATKLREHATDVQEAIDEVEGYLNVLKSLAVEVSVYKSIHLILYF